MWFLKSALNNHEAKKELDKIKEIEKTGNREKLFDKKNEYTFSFKNFQTIKSFDRDIYEGKITIEEANQTDLLAEIINFRKNTETRSYKKQEEKIVLENLYNFFWRQRKVYWRFWRQNIFDRI